MPTKFLLPDRPELIVASDIHVRDSAGERAELLAQLLDEAIRVQPSVFVLNGDIFDFFFGWSPYFRDKYRGIFSRLEQLSTQGSRVYFVEGNHEFGMSRMQTNGVTYLSGFGDVIETPSGVRVLIVHGDLMKHDWKYLLFRSIVRSNFVNIVASMVPQSWLDRWTQWFARTSRKKDKYRTLNHQSILACAVKNFNAVKADHMIFGHFHHPYDERDERGGRILSVDSWDVPSCLVFKDGKFQRVKPQS